jgi:hypothetical protein
MEGFLAIERGWFLFILVGSGDDIRDLSPILLSCCTER